MARIANNYTALLSGSTWWGPNIVPSKPVFITYSFETRPYDYLYEDGHSAAFIRSFRPLTSVQKAEAEKALDQWDDASGIHFLRVAAGQGDIRFGNYDLDDNVAGLGAYPATRLDSEYSYSLDGGGDVFLDFSSRNYPRDDLQHLLVHEIGHGLGLKHPFEGSIRLDSAHDNTNYSVMSYDGYAPDLGSFDISAVRHLYGTDAQDGKQVASWSWNAATSTLTQKGFGGADVIRGVSTSDIIDGKAGNDVIFASAGKDTIRGGLGNDILTGGDGADQFIFDTSLRGGYDKLEDFTRGSDKIVLDHSVFAGLAVGRLNASQFYLGGEAHDASDRIIYDGNNLYYDVDGTGRAPQVHIAYIGNNNFELSNSDFLIIV